MNLVRSLRASGHIVTFVPDCEKWHNAFHLVRAAICRSLRTTTASELGIERSINSDSSNILLEECIEIDRRKLRPRNWGLTEELIETITGGAKRGQSQKKKRREKIHWILVFDQLNNRTFGRKGKWNLKDIEFLEYPFCRMTLLHNYPYVHTVISASANNSFAYNANHEGFKVFEHPLEMSDDEIKAWKPELNNYDDGIIGWKELVATAGKCPLQVKELLGEPSKEDNERRCRWRCRSQHEHALMEECDISRKGRD